MNLQLALFDLDNTLLNGDSDHSWGEHLIDAGWVDAQYHRQKNDAFYADYQAGRLDIYAYQAFVLEPLLDKPWEDIQALRADFVEHRIKPMISSSALHLVEHHRQQQHQLVIITATNRLITEPIAKLFQVPHLIATEPELLDGQLTGRITGIPSFQAGKIQRLYEWLGQTQPDLSQSYFYSDSYNDLPLLKQVGFPCVVNPDDRLKAHAESMSWPMISLSS